MTMELINILEKTVSSGKRRNFIKISQTCDFAIFFLSPPHEPSMADIEKKRLTKSLFGKFSFIHDMKLNAIDLINYYVLGCKKYEIHSGFAK